jgi:chaperonin GroEL
MSAKTLYFGTDLHDKMKQGARTLEHVVAGTLGPSGGVVLFRDPFRGGAITATKDGVTVAKTVVLEDQVENLAASMIIYAANQVNEAAGDGTTTTTILTSQIYQSLLKNLYTAGISPSNQILGDFNKIREDIINMIEQMSKPVKTKNDVRSVAYIASNSDDEIADNISKAVELVGKDGLILVSPGITSDTEVTSREGFYYPVGPYRDMVMGNLTEIQIDNPLFLITTIPIESNDQIVPIMQKALKENVSLVVVAPEFKGVAQNTMLTNITKGIIKMIPIMLPGLKSRQNEFAEDLARYTGTTVISQHSEVTLKDVELTQLGSSQQIRVKKSEMTILDGNYDEDSLLQYIDSLKSLKDTGLTAWEIEKVNERISRLTGGFAEIKVGGVTESNIYEKKDRYDDALNATRTAITAGTVLGGGVTWLKVSDLLRKNPTTNNLLVADAMEKVTWWIINNGSGRGDQVIERIRASGYKILYNAKTRDFEDVETTKVQDSAKCLTEAITAAISTAITMYSTECAIIDNKEVNGVD